MVWRLYGSRDHLPFYTLMQNFYRLKEACCFYPYYGRPNETAFIVRAPDNRQFKISALAKDILLSLTAARHSMRLRRA